MKRTVLAILIAQAMAKGEFTPAPELLPDGVSEHRNGTYWAKCRSCGRSYELFTGPVEFDPEYSYCGGNPWCIP